LKEIFEQYGGVIITVVAIAALAALVTAIMGNGTSGPVYDEFKNLIDNFGNNIGTP
jgi:NAD(P)H-hydrate repair Nnr-like enzyme with NAD(P)H-hydrate epimerase domain